MSYFSFLWQCLISMTMYYFLFLWQCLIVILFLWQCHISMTMSYFLFLWQCLISISMTMSCFLWHGWLQLTKAFKIYIKDGSEEVQIVLMIKMEKTNQKLLFWVSLSGNIDLISSPCQRQCELLPSLGVRRLSSFNFSHFNLLLWNPLTIWNETW